MKWRLFIALLVTAIPLRAQTGPVMCYDSTRAAYYPRPTRVGDTLITDRRTATTVCVKPLRQIILVRLGDTDTIVTQPGAQLGVPIIVEPGVAALQMKLGYATSRLILIGADGLARMQWIDPWFGSMNPTTLEFNIASAAGSTVKTTVARAWFTVRSTTGRTNVTLTAPTIATNASGQSVLSRISVRNVVICVVSC